MRFFVLLMTMVFSFGLTTFTGLAFSQDIPSGANWFMFKKFFVKQQPKEYHEFSTDPSERTFYPDAKKVYLHYKVMEDFSKPNTWGILSPSEQFKNTTTNKTPTTDADLLYWKTFKESEVDSSTLPPINRLQTSRQSLPTIMGVRSLFLTGGYKTITIYPKSDLYLPFYNIHSIDFWLFSTNQPYRAYVILEAPSGELYKIYAGDIQYFGWRRLSASIDFNKIIDEQMHPSLVYTKLVETRLKLHSVAFESKYITATDGFFGVWISDLGIAFDGKVNLLKDGMNLQSSKLGSGFDWDDTTSNKTTALEDNSNNGVE